MRMATYNNYTPKMKNMEHNENNKRCYAKSLTYGDSTIASTDCTCPEVKEDWEKEFDELLSDYLSDFHATSLGMYGEAEGKKLNKENDEKLINFIHSLLLAREQEARTKAIEDRKSVV